MIDSGHLHSFICVCSHLGKYNASSQRPRPIGSTLSALLKPSSVTFNVSLLDHQILMSLLDVTCPKKSGDILHCCSKNVIVL